MRGKQYNGANATPLAMLLALTLVVALDPSCQRIEFEPSAQIYLTTDSVKMLEDGSIRMYGSIIHTGGELITEHGFCWSDSVVPTLAGPSSQLGPRESAGQYYSDISGLAPKTTFYLKSYAIAGDQVAYGNERSVRTPAPVIDSFLTDIDGNTYPVIIIGEQAWMAENLRTTRYADGTPVPLVDEEEAWGQITGIDKAFSWYYDDPGNSEIFGAYYSWAAAMNGAPGSISDPSGVQGVCPEGWHLPSDAEWNEMHIALGMRFSEADDTGFIGNRAGLGSKMKGFGFPLWEGYEESFNASGFTALPCGLRSPEGKFENTGTNGYFWSSSDFSGLEAWCRHLQDGNRGVLRVHLPKPSGFSVRCVLDE